MVILDVSYKESLCAHMNIYLHECANASMLLFWFALPDAVGSAVGVRKPVCHPFFLPFCMILGLTPNVSGHRYLSWVKNCSLVHMSD